MRSSFLALSTASCLPVMRKVSDWSLLEDISILAPVLSIALRTFSMVDLLESSGPKPTLLRSSTGMRNTCRYDGETLYTTAATITWAQGRN